MNHYRFMLDALRRTREAIRRGDAEMASFLSSCAERNMRKLRLAETQKLSLDGFVSIPLDPKN